MVKFLKWLKPYRIWAYTGRTRLICRIYLSVLYWTARGDMSLTLDVYRTCKCYGLTSSELTRLMRRYNTEFSVTHTNGMITLTW
jgi:hypothetical protein